MRAALLLAALEARRAAPPGLLLLVAVVALAAAHLGAGGAADGALAGLIGRDGGVAALDGLARASALTAGLLIAAPVLVVHAAGVAGRWRAGDGDWLGARPISGAAAFGASLAGLLFASALFGAVLGLASASVGAGDARALVWSAGVERSARLEPGFEYAEALAAAPSPPGALLRVRVRNAVGVAPYCDARLEVERAGVLATAEARVDGNGWLEVAAPAGAGALDVRVRCLGPGPLVVVAPRPLELWRAAGSVRRVDLALGARSLWLLAAAALAAAALGAWLAPPLAALGVLALAVLLAGAGGGDALPGLGLLAALDVVREGRMPAPIPAAQVLATLAALPAAILVALPALRSWRHGR